MTYRPGLQEEVGMLKRKRLSNRTLPGVRRI